jgi:hypothetical protein
MIPARGSTCSARPEKVFRRHLGNVKSPSELHSLYLQCNSSAAHNLKEGRKANPCRALLPITALISASCLICYDLHVCISVLWHFQTFRGGLYAQLRLYAHVDCRGTSRTRGSVRYRLSLLLLTSQHAFDWLVFNNVRHIQGVNVKTRKRNVAVPHDPSGFADSVLKLLDKNCSDVEDISGKLAAAVKALDASKLDFARYGVELFEIFFAGARMGVGTKLADDTKEKLDWNVRTTA